MAKQNEKWLTAEELAEMLDLHKVTLAAWRAEGKGPAFIKAGRRVRYRPSDIEEWVEANTRTSTDKSGRSTTSPLAKPEALREVGSVTLPWTEFEKVTPLSFRPLCGDQRDAVVGRASDLGLSVSDYLRVLTYLDDQLNLIDEYVQPTGGEKE